MQDMGKSTSKFFSKVKDKVKGVYRKWKHNSSNLIDDFIKQFDKKDEDPYKLDLMSIPSELPSEMSAYLSDSNS